MDYLYIEKVVKELQTLKKERLKEPLITDRKITLDFGRLKLNCYLSTPNALFLSRERIGEAPFTPLNPLKGAYLKEVSLPYKDRVVELSFVKLLSPTEFEKYFLILELTGKNANLFLLDSERRIKFLLRAPKTTKRELSLKSLYAPPPLDKRPFEELNFGRISSEGIERGLYKHALFISPLNAKEIACLYRELKDLKKAYGEFMKRHESSETAYLYYESSKPKYLTTFKYCSLNLPYKEFKGEFPYSRVWEEFYKEAVLKREVKSLKERLLNRLIKRKEALLKELALLKSPKELLLEAERSRYLGELLKFNLHKVKPGSSEVEVEDYERGEKVKIPLDPALSPKENMERLFKAYKKLKRKAEIADERRREIEEEVESINSLISMISELQDETRLRKLLKTPLKEREETGISLKAFTLPSGRKIVVGRSSRENELISLKLSNPWDYWFHAKGVPGSHVILKVEKGKEPTDEDVLIAASAAAYFSKGRHSGKVPVDYTLVKNLKKPPKSPKGFVVYKGEKTLFVRPEEFKEKFLKEEAPEKGAD
ncbi:Rqc2 family fibronectin-binding protein [Thermovibrio sp.]